MSFDPRDYDGETFESEYRKDAERYAAQKEEREEAEAREEAICSARYANFLAGRCSGEAADNGGAQYDMEMAASAIPEPIVASVNGWLMAMGAEINTDFRPASDARDWPGGAPRSGGLPSGSNFVSGALLRGVKSHPGAYAAIGNGLFVRVGTGKGRKRRAA